MSEPTTDRPDEKGPSRKNVVTQMLSTAGFFLAARFLTLGYIQQDVGMAIVGFCFLALGVHFLPIWRGRHRSSQ